MATQIPFGRGLRWGGGPIRRRYFYATTSAARSSHTTYLGPQYDRTAATKDALCRWLRTGSKLPNCVLPDGPCNLFPEAHREVRLASEPTDQGTDQVRVVRKHNTDGSPERPFRPSYCATTFYKLTFRVGSEAADNWFISPAPAAQLVSQYLETALKIQKPQSRVLSAQDLLGSPFDTYIHTQSPGDLLIIPPLWYAKS